MKTLTVIHAFGDYRRGDRITDPARIAEVLAGENACHVVATHEAPTAPIPSPEAQ
jgi:hypothetical protein